MRKFGLGRATKLVAVMALVGAPTLALLSQSPAGAVTEPEGTFRTAFGNTSNALVTLTGDVNLTCNGGGEALRTDGVDVTVDGAGFTITQTCPNYRVLDNGSGTLTLKNVTVTGGSANGDGGGVFSVGSVILDAATVRANSASSCDGGGIFVIDGNLTLSNASLVDGNHSDCDGGGVYVDSGDFAMSGGSTLSNNTAAWARGGYFADGAVAITDSTVTNNHALDGEGGGGEAFGGTTITNSTISINDSTEEGGGFESDGGSTVVTNSTITGNQTNGDGGGFNQDGESSPTVTVTDSTISNNTAGSDGGGFDLNTGTAVTVTGSTLSGNAAPSGSGGALSTESEEGVTLTMVNSTVTGNSQPFDSAIDARGDGNVSANLVYDTIDNNSVTEAVQRVAATSADPEAAAHPEREVHSQTTDEPANLRVSDTLTTFGTVIVQPQGSSVNCELNNPTDTLGDNFTDDGSGNSCDFSGSTDSNSASNDALLGALADNTGPTMTQLPATDSPLVDAIPTSACGNGDDAANFTVTDDQRHVTRPQGKGCEIGSVELRTASLVVTKVVTGANGNAVPSAGYAFDATCSDGTTGTLTVADATNGGTSTALDGILPGSTCSVTEEAVAYTNPAVTGQPVVTYDPVIGPALAEGQTETVTVTNDFGLINLLGLVVIQPKFTG